MWSLAPLAFLGVFVTNAFAHEAPGARWVLIPSGVEAARVRQAVIDTCHGRKWTVVEATDARVVCNLKHDHVDATVDLQLGDAEVSFHWHGRTLGRPSSGSPPHMRQRLRHHSPVAEGSPRPIPSSWIRNIEVDLRRRLERIQTAGFATQQRRAGAPAATDAGSGKGKTVAKLEMLRDLYDRGLISDEVWRSEQEKVLDASE